MNKVVCEPMGGFSDVKDVDEDIQKICDNVKSQAEQKTGKTYKVFTGIIYRSQVVTGRNYLIKVHVGGDDHVHILVYQALPYTGKGPELVSIRECKTSADILDV
ncbi:cystatin-B-like [Syngnathus scovelli]|uniref:cystatin-B-like n=1 Tax=Syngnathus scovelli TaxID=161590 RepID=UPI002110DED6|nr:cystatin-B-like [Syngnathus scovelli]